MAQLEALRSISKVDQEIIFLVFQSAWIDGNQVESFMDSFVQFVNSEKSLVDELIATTEESCSELN